LVDSSALRKVLKEISSILLSHSRTKFFSDWSFGIEDSQGLIFLTKHAILLTRSAPPVIIMKKSIWFTVNKPIPMTLCGYSGGVSYLGDHDEKCPVTKVTANVF